MDDFHIKLPLVQLSFENRERPLTKNDMNVFQKSIASINRALIKSFADLMDLSDGRWIDNVYATRQHSILNIDKFTFKDGRIFSEYIVRVQQLWHGCQQYCWTPIQVRKLLQNANAQEENSYEANDLSNDLQITDLLDHGTHVK